MSDSFNVFVYGTLKGMDVSRFKSRFVCRGRTKDGMFQMWGGGFPLVRPVPEGEVPVKVGHVKGEFFVVNSVTFAALDAYEGYPGFYNRQEVEIELENGDTAVAWMYVGSGALDGIPNRPEITPQNEELYWPWPGEHKEDWSNDSEGI